jgi:hypothetical protein
MRDLNQRILTVNYHIDPDSTVEGGKATRKQALNALDGIYDVLTEIEHQLGIGDVARFPKEAA